MTDGAEVTNTITGTVGDVSKRTVQAPVVSSLLETEDSHELDLSSSWGGRHIIPLTVAMRTFLIFCGNSSLRPDGIRHALLRHVPDDSVSFLLVKQFGVERVLPICFMNNLHCTFFP